MSRLETRDMEEQAAAKPSVPAPSTMDYACGLGAECDSIQPSGPCCGGFQDGEIAGGASREARAHGFSSSSPTRSAGRRERWRSRPWSARAARGRIATPSSRRARASGRTPWCRTPSSPSTATSSAPRPTAPPPPATSVAPPCSSPRTQATMAAVTF
ncbi:hypothetical protein GQ55_4G312000 [Panicum hallii var. hallii]|uniref:Uncharacterized protein n=1 Tax=Panicum hallii var. hallii TaxID=1504633 RepID=A0A2T7E1Y3_9POAL|nr:hypothetical protein GQ55_4G312000 [Panicum hallii var. hallii]PUZ61865.1 hypothetical protein GQ55_4G312000 [Panicum hallii var. hallii]